MASVASMLISVLPTSLPVAVIVGITLVVYPFRDLLPDLIEAGFEVIDIGINTDADGFIAAIEEHKPDMLGMSALLTTTMPYMKVVVEEMASQGIRDDYIVLVGGAPLNEEFGKAVGADGYCRDAAQAADIGPGVVRERREREGADA